MKKIILMINMFRSNYDLSPITYNYTLHNKIDEFRLGVNDSWFYEHGLQSTNFTYGDVTRTNNLKGSFLALDGSKYMFRDTYKDSIPKIIRMRINQIVCFDFNKCSNESFNMFTTCVKNPIIFENNLPCSWAQSYTPFLLLPSLNSIAIADLNTQGIYVPDNLRKVQMKSFWIYGNFDKPLTDRDVCSKSLCSSKFPK